MNSTASIYDSFSPLYKASKLVGILPFGMNLRTGGVSVNFCSISWMIFWWIVQIVLIVLNLQGNFKQYIKLFNFSHFFSLYYFLFYHKMFMLFYFQNKVGAREPGENSEIILSSWHWLLIFQIFSSFYIQILNLMKRKNIENLFKLLSEFDDAVS